MQLPEKRCIYTVITGGYDPLFPPLASQPGWDMLAFTDDGSIQSPVWQVRPLPALPELASLASDPTRAARLVKILAHRFLQEYEYSVYIDGNRILNGSMDAYAGASGDAFLCLGSVYADAYAAVDALLDRTAPEDGLPVGHPLPLEDTEREKLCAQKRTWEVNGLPRWGGCPGTGVLARRHNAPAAVAVAETWAAEVQNGSAFDEPAFPYACFCHGATWAEGLSRRTPPNEPYSAAWEFAPAVPHAAVLAGANPPAKPAYPQNPPPPGGPYGGYPLLLTIGVPVSNQIATIRRCLDGIKPILDAVPSELVVVDTGSTDGTIEVCREYGARVVEFPWVNDMSAARNIGIRNAQSMWYLSIDDDEWFEDTAGITAFFSEPGKYKRHDALVYQQLNYLDDFAKDALPHPTRRAARVTPGLHFEGRIHDALVNPDIGNTFRDYITGDSAHHYGFSATDRDAAAAKCKRNLSALRYDLAQFPYDSRYAFQTGNEYFVAGRDADAYPLVYWANAVECIAGCYPDMILLANMQTLTHLHQDGFHEAALRFAARHIRAKNYGFGDLCALYYILADIRHAKREYEAALELAGLYTAARESYHGLDDLGKTLSSRLSHTNYHNSETACRLGLLRAEALLALHKTDEAEALLLAPDMLENLAHIPGTSRAVCQHILAGRRWDFCAALWRARLALGANQLYALYPDMEEAATAQTAPGVLGVLAQISAPPSAFEPLLRLRAMQPGDADAQAALADVVEKLPAFTGATARHFKRALLLEALRHAAGPVPVLAALHAADVDDFFDYLGECGNPPARAARRRIAGWFRQAAPAGAPTERYFHLRAARLLLDLRADEISSNPAAYREAFSDYISEACDWYAALYQPALFEGDCPALLPAAPWAAVLIRRALAARENDKLAALRDLKAALELDAGFERAIAALIGEIRDEAARGDTAQRAQSAELTHLLRGIKPKIEQLIATGMQAEAVAVITQLEALAPGDPELAALREKAGV